MAFRGWPTEALDFYEGLEADNSKTYWTAHRAVYEDKVLAPMEALLAELEPEFGAGRIFRPYRDVRFSADKSPYKTAIGATLEHGGYVQLSAKGLAAGAGMYQMGPAELERYRRAVADDVSGDRLRRVVAALAAQKVDVTGHESLRTVPRGYPKDHPRADLLRHKGLISWKEWPAGAWLGRSSAKARVIDFFRASRPLTTWLFEHIAP
jgi:uncharacterized protein (TIGR02453 family)